ncbi:MAG TPA: HAD-IA family hydrolase [Ktedonobacteraceae bacterium]|nr:HAD-IA family hydrolase [Ktedonobacteraceae bacterium]
MKFGCNVRCILFDLGGTLWMRKEARVERTCERIANLQAVLELFRYAGSKFHPEMDVDELGQVLRKSFERQIRDKTHQHGEYEPDFVLAAMDALHQLGVPGVTREFGEAIYEALRVRSPDSRALFDDALSTLAGLKERGYLLGVVTNRHYGGAPFHEDLRAMGLLDYFELRHMAISADLGIRKPHPDIFLHALNSLNVLPEEAAMVGDSLRADIVGAKRLDILAIWRPKAPLREEARAALHAEAASGDVKQQELTDDYLLAYTRQIEKRGRQTPDDIKPDAIIECLSDLLAMF